MDDTDNRRPLRAIEAKDVERKLYTFAFGFVGLAIVVWTDGLPYSVLGQSAVYKLLHLGVAARAIIVAEHLIVELATALVTVPLLKATRHHLSIGDAILVSLPATYVDALSFGDGFEPLLLIRLFARPVSYVLMFRMLSLRAIPSLIDEPTGTIPHPLRLALSLMFSFQFAVLFIFLSGATLPFRVKLAYLLFSAGALVAIAARLKPHIVLVVVAFGMFVYNVLVFSAAVAKFLA